MKERTPFSSVFQQLEDCLTLKRLTRSLCHEFGQCPTATKKVLPATHLLEESIGRSNTYYMQSLALDLLKKWEEIETLQAVALSEEELTENDILDLHTLEEDVSRQESEYVGDLGRFEDERLNGKSSNFLARSKAQLQVQWVPQCAAFGRDILNMYRSILSANECHFKSAEVEFGERIIIDSETPFHLFRYEKGVHRAIQNNLYHLVTVSLDVADQCDNSGKSCEINENEFDTSFIKKGGPGGSRRMSSSNAALVRHKQTGLQLVCIESRSAMVNKEKGQKKLMDIINSMRERASPELSTKYRVQDNYPSSRIRSYNYDTNMITDHRVKKNFGHMTETLRTGHGFDQIHAECERHRYVSCAVNLIRRLKRTLPR